MNLDREIEDLLAVDHSPEFLAKVRARVAAEPAPAAPWWPWALVPAGAGLAALAAAAMLWPFAPSAAVTGVRRTVTLERVAGGAPLAESARPEAAAPAPVAIPAAPAPVATPAAPARASASEATVAGRAPRAGAEIVISPEDARAFRLLLARVRQGLVVTVPEGELELGEAVVGPPWIEIEPVVIEPLAQLAQDEGGRQ